MIMAISEFLDETKTFIWAVLGAKHSSLYLPELSFASDSLKHRAKYLEASYLECWKNLNYYIIYFLLKKHF